MAFDELSAVRTAKTLLAVLRLLRSFSDGPTVAQRLHRHDQPLCHRHPAQPGAAGHPMPPTTARPIRPVLLT
jgi:hypothetical protein